MTTIRPGSPVVNSCGVVIGIALPNENAAPVIRTVADAEELLGRGAAVIHARGGVAEHLAAEVGGPFVGSNPTEREVAAALNNLRLADRVAPSPEARVCPACFGRTVVAHFSYRREAGELVKCQRCCGTGLRSHEDIADALGIPWPSEGDDLAHAPPPVDLAAENAALRAALDASGELLAEAHAELERLRGER